MGVKVNRIEKEFILNKVNDNKSDIHIHGEKKEYIAKITNIEDEYLEVVSAQTDWQEFSEEEDLRVFFSYYGHVMTFNSSVINIDEHMRIKMPDIMYRNLQRKYERVAGSEEMSVSFIVNEQRIELNFPRSEEYEAIDELEFSDDWKTDDLGSLISQFRTKMQQEGVSDTIRMFREYEPKAAWELLVASTGKILYIPTFHSGIPADGAGLHPRILTHPYFQLIIDGHHFEKIDKDEFLQYLEEKKRAGTFSILCCPILYYEYTIGYIHLESERKIGKETLEYVFDFSRVLSYVLLHKGYFKDKKYRPYKYDTEIADISASGLLFSHASPDLKANLMLYADVELNLMIGQRKLKITSRVMRKYPEKDGIFYGLQFMDMQPEDFRFLFDYVYGRDFTADDEIKWEGGADAPEISFSEKD